MKKILLNFVLFFSLFLFSLFFLVKQSSAATLEFSPLTGTYTTGTNFSIEIKVNAEGQDTQSADAVINFDTSFLNIENVSYGSFYESVLHSDQNGVLSISGSTAAPDKVTGTGTLATVTFKGLKAGTAKLSFECETGRTDESNITINDSTGSDLIVCSSLTEGSYTLTGETIDNTPTDGATNTGTTGTSDTSDPIDYTGTADTIPATGFLDFTPLLPKLLMGLLFVAIGLVPLLI